MKHNLQKLSSIYSDSFGDIPVIMMIEPLTEDLSYILNNAMDTGEVFFQLLESDVFGEVTKEELLLRNSHKVFLCCSLCVDTYSLIQKHKGFLFINSSKQLDANNLSQNPMLDDIEQWTLNEEKRLGLDEYSVSVVLVIAKILNEENKNMVTS